MQECKECRVIGSARDFEDLEVRRREAGARAEADSAHLPARRRCRALRALGMAAFAAEFCLLPFLLAGFAAVLAPFATLGDHAIAGRVCAFLKSFSHVDTSCV
jgi:hypothetical protein